MAQALEGALGGSSQPLSLQEPSDSCLLIQPHWAGGSKWGSETLSRPEDPRKPHFSGRGSKDLRARLDSVAIECCDPARTLSLWASAHLSAQHRGGRACLPGLLDFTVGGCVPRNHGWGRPGDTGGPGGQAPGGSASESGGRRGP